MVINSFFAVLILVHTGLVVGSYSAIGFAKLIGPEYLDVFTYIPEDEDDDEDDEEEEEGSTEEGEEAERQDNLSTSSAFALFSSLKKSSDRKQLEQLLVDIDEACEREQDFGERRRLHSLSRFVVDEITLIESQKESGKQKTLR